MQAFTVHTGLVAPLHRANVDTDQIVPKQFLKLITRTGFGKVLFYNWRFGLDGTPHPDFVLNDLRYQEATILVAGKNFGSGSSREHAVWALQDYGFRVVISSMFADIFHGNCFKSGLLPVTLAEAEVEEIMKRATANPGYLLTVDLERCVVRDNLGFAASFHLDSFHRYCLLNGLDEIGLTLVLQEKIDAFEASR